MKRFVIPLLISGVALYLLPLDCLARGLGGGRAGGGSIGGGGGISRPSFSQGASPALGGGNRGGAGATPRPGGGTIGSAAGGRPAGTPGGAVRPGGAVAGANTRPGAGGRVSTGQLNNFLDLPGAGAGAAVGTRPAAGGGAAADFLQLGGARPTQPIAGSNRTAVVGVAGAGGAAAVRPAVRPAVGAGAVGSGALATGAGGVRQAVTDNRAGRIENRQEWQGNRHQRRDEIRSHVAVNHPRLDFWTDHPHWAAWRINHPYRWATWAVLAGWCGCGEATTYSYGENVYYTENQVYYGDQAVATAEEYAQQAEAIAARAPETKAEASEWLPLGVFAITQDGQASGADPNLFLQLAINKQGVINGTLKNMLSGQVQDIEGMADKKSQRAAWTAKGQQRPVMETGLANFTQDTGPALIHFANGQTQQWLLVRLEEPKGS